MRRLLLPLMVVFLIPVMLYAKDFKRVSFTTDNAGTVVFDHTIHLNALGSECTVCHNSLFSLVQKNPKVTMAEMEKGKSCGVCHNKVKAFALAECTRCHVVKEVPINIPDFGTVTFSHSFHLGMYGCADCHNSIFKAGPDNPHFSMSQMERGEACGACHDGKTAFSVTGKCTSCHSVKNISFAADVQFSHDFHLQIYKCNDCHSKLFVAGPNSKRHTMQSMEKGNSCGGCHNGNTAFSVKGDCGTCHKSVKEVSFKAGDAFFSHKVHTALLDCGSCHSGIFIGGINSKRYSMADMSKGQSCGVCHEGSSAFTVNGNCAKCHKSTREITFKTENAGPVGFSHSLHTGMYSCDECHNRIFPAGVQKKSSTMDQMEKGQSCGACHDGKTAFNVAGSDTCSKCHPVKDITFAYDGRFSHNRHLTLLSCSNCHNSLYKAGPENRRWDMAAMEKGQSCGVCHNGSTGFTVSGECGKCHASVAEVAFNVPQAGITRFSHKLHTGMYGCGDCHNSIFTTGKAAKRFTMSDMEAGKSCGACHDGKTAFAVKGDCSKCHPAREIPFKESGAFFSHQFHTAAYRCSDCHDRIFKPTSGNRPSTMADMEGGRSCGACHDGNTAFTVKENCEKCHTSTKAIKYEIPGEAGNVLFSHKVHLTKGYGCTDCHSKVVKAGIMRRSSTMKEMQEGKSCGACHGFSMAFSVKDQGNCERCHKAKLLRPY